MLMFYWIFLELQYEHHPKDCSLIKAEVLLKQLMAKLKGIHKWPASSKF